VEPRELGDTRAGRRRAHRGHAQAQQERHHHQQCAGFHGGKDDPSSRHGGEAAIFWLDPRQPLARRNIIRSGTIELPLAGL
jgi:hypothetical protein